MSDERPQRPVSRETHQRIAEGLDESATWAEEHGYPEGAEHFRGKAARYRERNGLTGQQDNG